MYSRAIGGFMDNLIETLGSILIVVEIIGLIISILVLLGGMGVGIYLLMKRGIYE
jgi:hypothetical protein